MMMKVFVPALLLLTLAACGGAECVVESRGQRRSDPRGSAFLPRPAPNAPVAENLDVTRDIRGGSISGGRDDTREFVESTRDIKAARSYERLFAQCMRGTGLYPVKDVIVSKANYHDR